MDLDQIRAGAEALLEELSTEVHAALAGFKPGADLQPIYAKHAAAYSDDVMASVRALYDKSVPGSEEHRSARLLLDWLIDSGIGRELAPLDERDLKWESTAQIKLPNGELEPYQRAAITIANSTNRAERETIDSARSALVAAELSPLKQEKFDRERTLYEATKVAPNYIGTFESLAALSLHDLRDQCAAFLRDTQAIWDEVLPPALKARLNITVGEATRADALALFRAQQFDGAFPAEAMEREVRRHVTDMGASPDAGGRVKYDTGEREGKRSRAFCAPVRIPEVVHLVIRPHGGQNDWMTLLHELGHALHFGNAERTLPFEYRWLGDNSVTEGYAMLFDHRLKNAGWLQRYTGLGKANVAEYLRFAGLEELHYLRRYCAKLTYEMELYGGKVSWSALPDLFVETLSGATSFRYRTSDAFVDVDPRFYSARYLRAWQLQSLLDETLTERFDSDWWRNPNAGPWIVGELFGHGQRELAHEQAQRVSGKALGFAPLIRSIERMLG
jgi:hypothetical protein